MVKRLSTKKHEDLFKVFVFFVDEIFILKG